MAKLKPVLPSLREKKRYLVFEIISKKPVKEFSGVSKAIWKSILDLSGVLGASKAGIWLLGDKFNKDKQTGIIKVNHKNVDLLKAALCVMMTAPRGPLKFLCVVIVTTSAIPTGFG